MGESGLLGEGKVYRSPELWCVLKHLLLAWINTQEFIEDLNERLEFSRSSANPDSKLQELQEGLVEALDDVNSLCVDVGELCKVKYGFAGRMINILSNLVAGEYHCIERTIIAENEEKKRELLDLARNIRKARKKYMELLFTYVKEKT